MSHGRRIKEAEACRECHKLTGKDFLDETGICFECEEKQERSKNTIKK